MPGAKEEIVILYWSSQSESDTYSTFIGPGSVLGLRKTEVIMVTVIY